jgi:xanthine dehydrogenase molybdopterin-binding subunit B
MSRHIGKRISLEGAYDFATGRRLFAEDMLLDHPLALRVFRSKAAHARLLNVEVEKARKIPGVVGVLTAKDIPGKNLIGFINKDQPFLAHDKVRFEGEAIALVAAENEDAAEAALHFIQADYEELPALFDPEASSSSGEE